MISNNMTELLNRIEIRLGTRRLNLPETCDKSTWADIIKTMTIPMYSQFFPNEIAYEVNPLRDWDAKTKTYFINEDIIPGDVRILGMCDYMFNSNKNSNLNAYSSYGQYDFFTSSYAVEDIALSQVSADMISLVNNVICVEYIDPHRFRLVNTVNNNVMHNAPFEVKLFIQHSDSLSTIVPTQMIIFENLAMSDIATFLYGELKYFEGLETVFGSIDIKLSDIQSIADRREDYINELRDAYVSPSNKYQPMWYTV